MKNKKIFLLLPAVLLALGACSGTKETLGLEKKAPDEFAVVKRAPLSMPPDYTLRPPQPGAPRPQEQATSEQARQAVFGDEATAEQQPADLPDGAEGSLLQQAGAVNADPSIRRKVDKETAEMGDYNKPVAQRLLGIGGTDEPSATIVNAKKETARLKKNQEEGRPLTEGETPSIEQ